MKRSINLKGTRRLVAVLVVSNLISVMLLLIRIVATDERLFSFLVWNLFLAWIPLVAAWFLIRRLKKHPWINTWSLVLSGVWLAFLPNTFYIVSDLVHLQVANDVNILYDVVMLTSFSWNGFVLGFMSLYMVHKQLLSRLTTIHAHGVVGIVLLLCSFAIYLGRYLRWNSWDIILNPMGLAFDVSDRLVDPISHPQTFTTTLIFFVLLGGMYFVIYELVAALKPNRQDT